MNIATNPSINSGEAAATQSNTRLQQASQGASAEDSHSGEVSFRDSIQQARDESKHKQEKSETESGGNALPVKEGLSAAPADFDRTLLSDNLNADNKVADDNAVGEQNFMTALSSVHVGIDTDINVDDKLDEILPQKLMPANSLTGDEASVMSPQVRQLLGIDAATNTTKLRAGDATRAAIASDIESAASVIKKTLLLQTETGQAAFSRSGTTTDKNQPLVNITSAPTLAQTMNQSIEKAMEQAGLVADKGQVLASASGQILQTASSLPPISADGMPLITSTPINSLSTMNLQTLPPAEITETFGRPAWSQGIGKQIVWMVNQNIGSAEIRLNPAHLGPIEVLIDMSDDQVNVSMSSRHAIVREAMEQALPKLREMLDENGYTLSDTDISQHSFAEQREQNTDNDHHRMSLDTTAQSTTAAEADAVSQALAATERVMGMVDYYI